MTTPDFAHGLMIGKFYPPHHGHVHVISTAAAACSAVTVLVMGSTMESIDHAERADWLAEMVGHLGNVEVLSILDDAPMDYSSDSAWIAHIGLMAAAVRRGRYPAAVDAVFSSESYGAEMAARFGATAVAVDPDRVRYPYSSSMFRADVVGRWTELPPPVRRGLAVRVVVLGSESTGSTTLARDLAAHYRRRGGVWERTGCVDEYGREYTELKFDALQLRSPGAPLTDLTWDSADFATVAAEQTRQEDAAAAAGSPVLICDTDAFATAVWERRYVGEHSHASAPWATDLLPRRDIYLLTDCAGVDFEQDGWRDGEHLREGMQEWFADALTEAGHSWFLVSGSPQERLELAVAVTDELLGHRLSFRSPSWTIASGVAFGSGAGPAAGAPDPGRAAG